MVTACLQAGLSIGCALPQTIEFFSVHLFFFPPEGVGLFFGLREQEIGSGIGTSGSRKGNSHQEKRMLHVPLIQPPTAELVAVNWTSRGHLHLT